MFLDFTWGTTMNDDLTKAGVYDITNTIYHDSIGISRSMLMKFKRNPRHYWYECVSGMKQKEEPTPKMRIGSAVHTLVLEPHLFDKEFYVTHQENIPKKNTNPYFKMLEEAQGKTILSKNESDLASSVALAVKCNDEAKLLLSDCKIEQSIYFRHEQTGLLCKVRPDAWSGSLICDLKTADDAGPRAIQTSAMNYGYYLQAGMCFRALESLGIAMERFVLIVAEKSLPYSTAIYILTDEAIQFGLNQFDTLMNGLAKCIKSSEWPAYGIQDLGLPGYARFDEVLETL